ncbi:MAG: hypothetical protein OXG44_01370 [Gammaproteobacteria bacterium]|nr:hypothetical protein [Gammaproteobacteria bacterium]
MSEFRDLFGTRVELTIDNDGRPYCIAYDPSRWPVVHQVRTASEQIPWPEIIAMLAEVLIEWDLTLDGEPVPCTEESLSRFPRSILAQMHTRIYLHEAGWDPDAKKAEADQSGQSGTPR